MESELVVGVCQRGIIEFASGAQGSGSLHSRADFAMNYE